MLSLRIIASLAALVTSGCSQTPEPPSPPPPSVGPSLVWHDSLGAVLLLNAGLGGMNDAAMQGHATRIWSLSGSNWVLVDSGGPPLRNLGGVAYDSRRNVVVLYGGSDALGHTLGDLWEWKGSWTQRSPSGPVPGPRDHVQLAYDPVRRKTVLFGGQVRVDSFPRDTWEWDGAAWSRITGAGPPERVHYTMQYDPSAQRVVVAGGYQPGGSDLADAWEWNGAAWQPAAALPAARTHAVLAQDVSGAVVLVGGMGPGAGTGGFRRRSGGWDPLAYPPALARYLAGAAYDPARARLVVFGGGAVSNDEPLADTWLLSGGATWSRLQ